MFFKRFWWVGLIVLVLIAGAIAVVNNLRQRHASGNNQTQASTQQTNNTSQPLWPSQTAKYITAVPVELTQIQGISKYRSCAGHDFPGYDFERVQETNRSMKHYFYPVLQFQGTINQVKMFAPFDGTISVVDPESAHLGEPSRRPQSGDAITFTTPVDPAISFEFTHIYTVQPFKVGDKVTAGELIGYAALGNKDNDFDLVLAGSRYSANSSYGSIFDHMTDSVLAQFAARGVTPDNTKFTREFRDAHPCDFTHPTSRLGDDWVQVTN